MAGNLLVHHLKVEMYQFYYAKENELVTFAHGNSEKAHPYTEDKEAILKKGRSAIDIHK